MEGEWQTVTVGDLVDSGVIERPMDGNHGEIHPKSSDFVDQGIPFIMASNLANGNVDTVNCAFILEEQAKRLRKGFSITGDVLLSHKATMGRTAIVGKLDVPYIMLTPQVTYYRIKDSSRLDPRYLKFYFDGPRFQTLLESWANKGSTRAYLGIVAQLDLPVVVPPISIQRAIANILGTLDDKIELNHKINQTLEEMARAIFKSWFVDCESGHNRAKGGKRSTPESFETLTIGDVVSDIIDHRGKTPKKLGGDWAKDGIAAISAKNIKSGRLIQKDSIRFVSEKLYRRWMPVELQQGDIILTSEAPLGETLYLVNHKKYCLSQRLFALRANPSICTPEYLYYWICSNCAQEEMSGRSTGTTVLGIRQSELRKVLVRVPPIRRQQSFSSIVLSILQMVDNNEQENAHLAEIRDTFLPRLLSGNIHIENAERFIGVV